MRTSNPLIFKSNLSQNRRPHEEKYEIEHFDGSTFLFSDFILLLSDYLGPHSIIILRQISHYFNQELSHEINKYFLKKGIKQLLCLEKIYIFSELSFIFEDNARFSRTSRIDIPRLTTHQASALIDDCRQIKAYRREYTKALDPLCEIKEIGLNIYNKITGNKIYQRLLAFVPSLLTQVFSEMGYIAPLIHFILPITLMTFEVSHEIECIQVFQYFSVMNLLTQDLFSSVQNYRIRTLEKKINQFENKLAFWSSLPRTKNKGDHMQLSYSMMA